MTPMRPSGSSMKFPGWVSPCMISRRAGASNVSSDSRVPMRSRCSTVPSRMMTDIGMPSIHSAMTTFGALATIAGTLKCGCPA